MTPEQRHMELVARTGCVICREFLGVRTLGQVHHVADGTNPRDDFMVACLCEGHHQGNLPQPMGLEKVAVHKGVKRFCLIYEQPNEYYLIGLQNKYLAIDGLR